MLSDWLEYYLSEKRGGKTYVNFNFPPVCKGRDSFKNIELKKKAITPCLSDKYRVECLLLHFAQLNDWYNLKYKTIKQSKYTIQYQEISIVYFLLLSISGPSQKNKRL